MIKLKLRIPNTHKHIIERQKRERKSWYGMMVQYDWSYHPWIKWKTYCLLAWVDDATGKTVLQFAKWETLKDIFSYRKNYFICFGKPEIIYVDRHASYKVNHPEDQFSKEMKTRFERWMKALWILVIFSKQPQGKGRVERSFKTHQDRLVKELAYNNINNYEDAQKFLDEKYMKEYNKSFWKKAKDPKDYHKKISKKELENLEWYFAEVQQRILRRDWTIMYKWKIFQLKKWQSLPWWYQLTINESIYWNIKIYSWTAELEFHEISSRR
jgi:hypothetical protein